MDNIGQEPKTLAAEDFRKSLESLTAADLPFISPMSVPGISDKPTANPWTTPVVPAGLIPSQPNNAPATQARKRRQRRSRQAHADSGTTPHTQDTGTSTSGQDEPRIPEQIATVPMIASEESAVEASASNTHKGAIAGNGAELGAAAVGTTQRDASSGTLLTVPNEPSAANPTETATSTGTPGHKRNRPIREWPAVGTRLSAEYFGQTYRAEIIVAHKRLKSGKQIRLLEGPSAGKRCNSYSRAMLLATARQRREQKLGRKGVSNGWDFWREEVASGSSPTDAEKTSA